MLLVSSPSIFFALRRLVILLQKRRFGKKIRKTSKAMQATFTIKLYTIPFRLSIIFKEVVPIFQSSPKPQKQTFPQPRGKSVDHYKRHKHFVGQRCVMSPETWFVRLIFVHNHYFVRVRPHRNKIAKQRSFVPDGSEVALFNKLF